MTRYFITGITSSYLICSRGCLLLIYDLKKSHYYPLKDLPVASTAFCIADPEVSNDAETPRISASASAKASAIAKPIPRLQPATNTVFPYKLNRLILFLF
ncbi:hypothetical protein DSM02_1578 [Leeuwenhoekiella polynyae]|uniref:Uncharacterized protein n=1 Tax=Leeuwenhoekiella polynyae TaxID=1550906 RepID=A0A4V1KQW8_9FLAO|nr:hypothetical protein DSM02_1578 [Leeuwenhoekiella polynyae]